MNNENKQYIDQLSQEYLKGFGSESAQEAAPPVKIEPGKAPAAVKLAMGGTGAETSDKPAAGAKAGSGLGTDPVTAALKPLDSAASSAKLSFLQKLIRIFRRVPPG